jgi:bisphosphoglycerate-independent phosphoglycerate mutase (AlkP superfamily)
MSNLRHLNEERGRFHAMDRQLRQDQRYGPYDAVGWVDRPQYAYEERYHQQQYQYDEYEDGSSDETLF